MHPIMEVITCLVSTSLAGALLSRSSLVLGRDGRGRNHQVFERGPGSFLMRVDFSKRCPQEFKPDESSTARRGII
ncbi:hypothetical protein P691DRAFT_422153 [Macrolepiota fuliginosa MF-IS2]|uniref:Secreted protein n=1 Tax=Macrolepiota fuliginosa MF-IS2 TaxID=1400762 RepID=A0A9P5X2Q8_9AGAR|nr:hypothetical protein P691DRAFT_422153 [Macrolepiota fuliginosa MF-IS2]